MHTVFLGNLFYMFSLRCVSGNTNHPPALPPCHNSSGVRTAWTTGSAAPALSAGEHRTVQGAIADVDDDIRAFLTPPVVVVKKGENGDRRNDNAGAAVT